jgi:hypothetical protein
MQTGRLEAFKDENARTCKKCCAMHPGKKPPAGWANI